MQRFDIQPGNARLPVNFGSSSRLTNLGPGTVSYADSDEDTAQGSLAATATVNLSETRYLWSSALATVRVEDLTVGTEIQRLDALEGDVSALESVNVVVAMPTGVATTDFASWATAKAAVDAAGGGTITFRPGTYVIAPASGGKLLIPNNTTVVIPTGCTVQAAANTATGATNYVLFTGASLPPVGVRIVVDGVIDGNRRNGNHGPAEDIHAITLSDGVDCLVTGSGKFYNWRGEGVYVGHTGGGTGTANIPRRVHVIGPTFQDCGVMEVGDGGLPRMGVAYVAGTDCTVAYCHFDTIGGYAIDLEGDYANDHFDGMDVGRGCTFRNVGQGPINVTTPGAVSPTCRVAPAQASGPSSTATTTNASPNLTSVSPTTGWTNGCAVKGAGIPTGARIIAGAGTATMVMSANATASAGVAIDGVPAINAQPMPASRARAVRKRRYQGGDITLNSGSWADVDNTFFDITMPAQVGDLIRYTPNFLIAGVNTFCQFDVATIIGGSPVNYFSSDGSTPRGTGVGAWRVPNVTTQAFTVGPPAFYAVQAGDIVGGLVTLRLRYKQNAGTNQTLYSSAAVADSPADVAAENLGPGW